MQRESMGIVRIELPEHGFVDLPVAGLGRRGFAAIVDFAITLLVLILSVLALTLVLGGPSAGAIPAMVSVAVVLPIAVPLVMELVGRGQSLGKRWAKLRVVSQDGHPVASWQIAVRNVMRLVDFMPASYGLGLLLLTFTPRTQRVGDFIAGTLVVNESPDALLGLEVKAPSQQLAAVPEPLFRALRSLSSHRETLEGHVFERRRELLLERFRELRPDWRALDDEKLWEELDARH